MFFHIIENAQRNGVRGYRLVKTYKSVGAALNYAKREGKPVWIVDSYKGFIEPYVLDQKQAKWEGKEGLAGRVYGGFGALRWNSGSGLVGDTMPLLPLLA